MRLLLDFRLCARLEFLLAFRLDLSLRRQALVLAFDQAHDFVLFFEQLIDLLLNALLVAVILAIALHRPLPEDLLLVLID